LAASVAIPARTPRQAAINPELFVSYCLRMKRLHAIWILAVVLSLGSGYAVASGRTERGAEIQVLLCLSEQHCVQHFSNLKPPINWEETSIPIPSHYGARQSNRFVWPTVYQRPPTRSSLVQF
jgi:hypothetical protein